MALAVAPEGTTIDAFADSLVSDGNPFPLSGRKTKPITIDTTGERKGRHALYTFRLGGQLTERYFNGELAERLRTSVKGWPGHRLYLHPGTCGLGKPARQAFVDDSKWRDKYCRLPESVLLATEEGGVQLIADDDDRVVRLAEAAFDSVKPRVIIEYDTGYRQPFCDAWPGAMRAAFDTGSDPVFQPFDWKPRLDHARAEIANGMIDLAMRLGTASRQLLDVPERG